MSGENESTCPCRRIFRQWNPSPNHPIPTMCGCQAYAHAIEAAKQSTFGLRSPTADAMEQLEWAHEILIKTGYFEVVA